ncbi:hypothetical protein LTR49_028610 [Elasticomyces elasticus]|nr:hypothetical protein LTR49_028610 [Elasticomyces elasticus]
MPLPPNLQAILDRQSRTAANLQRALAANRDRTGLDLGPLNLPAQNIFARKWSKDDRHKNTPLTAAKYTKFENKAIAEEAANRRRPISERINARRAEDTHLKNTHLPGINESNYGIHRLKLANHSSDAQHQTLKYSRRTANHLVDATGGEAAWEDATFQQQRNLVTYLFAQFPLINCQRMFHYENQAFAFEQIWAVDRDDTTKWQIFWRSMFVNIMLESVRLFSLRRNGTEEEIKEGENELFEYWKIVKRAPAFDYLELGTAEDVLTRPTRSALGKGIDCM